MQTEVDSVVTTLDLPRIIYQKPVSLDQGQCDCACASLPSVVGVRASTRQGQCDCACTTTSVVCQHLATPLKNTAYLSTMGESSISIPLGDNYLATLTRDSGFVVLNQAAFRITKHFEQSRTLEDIPPIWSAVWGKAKVEAMLNEMVFCNLLLPEDYRESELIETSTMLTAWLHITDRCNLRCAYCYLPHEKSDMSFQTGQAAIAALFRSAVAHNYRVVKLKYAGGEPLMRFPLIKKLHQYAQRLAVQHNLDLEGVVLSNGTLLTSTMICDMQALGLRLMISVDGKQNADACQRPFVNGVSSSESAIQAVELALSHNLVPDISITVSGRNIRNLPKLIAWVLEHNLPFSFNFYRENDLSASATDLQLEEKQIVGGMLAVFEVIKSNLPHRSLLASLVDRNNLSIPHLHPCRAGLDYIVFDPQGCVAKCQMDIKNTITDANDSDPLGTIHNSSTGMHNPKVNEKLECTECQWQYWCAGGCPLEAYRTTGHYNTKSPNCSIYRTLYPEVIRLEGLRLLEHMVAVS